MTDEGRMAYIDSELAKRSQAQAQAQAQVSHAHSSPSTIPSVSFQPTKSTTDAKKELDAQRQPAALGKLLEIDLGDEERNKNVERTNQARRRLDGQEIEDETVFGKKSGKVRLGMEREVVLCENRLKSGVREAENGLVTLQGLNLKIIIVTNQ